MKASIRERGSGGKAPLSIYVEIANPGAVLLCSFLPAIYGLLLAYGQLGRLPVLMSGALVLIPCILNMSVNLWNDYWDYVAGNDTVDAVSDLSEAPILKYGLTDPRPVRRGAVAMFLAAAALGLGVVLGRCGPTAIVIGLVGVAAGLAYSKGPLPLSHLPLGELVAGGVLGLLIPLGVYSGLTGTVTGEVIYRCLPLFFVVAHIMLLNNTCDMERDAAAGRHTLPILMGRERAAALYRFMLPLWLLVTFHGAALWTPWGLPLYLIALLLIRRVLLASLRLKRVQATKTEDMGCVAAIGLVVALCLLAMESLQLILG